MKKVREIRVCPYCGSSNFHRRVRSHDQYCNHCKHVFVQPCARMTDIEGKSPKYLRKKEVRTCDVTSI